MTIEKLSAPKRLFLSFKKLKHSWHTPLPSMADVFLNGLCCAQIMLDSKNQIRVQLKVSPIGEDVRFSWRFLTAIFTSEADARQWLRERKVVFYDLLAPDVQNRIHEAALAKVELTKG